MMPRNAKAPTIPIPFHRLLSVVAVVDEKNPLTKQLLDEIAGFETDIHGLRFEPDPKGRRYLVDCIKKGSDR